MRYERKTPKGKDTPDWLTFKPGLSRKTFAQLREIAANSDQIAGWIDTCHIENDAGVFEAIDSEKAEVSLTLVQYDWVRECFWKWARDEALDPEV